MKPQQQAVNVAETAATQWRPRHARHANCSTYTCLYDGPIESMEMKRRSMGSSTWNEIEYLGSIEGKSNEDAALMREMSRRLDALRCFDQNFSDADWRPRSSDWPMEPLLKG